MSAPHRIDVQHHILPPAYVEAVGEEAIARLVVSGRVPDASPEASVAAMDRNGIATAVTSVSAPAFHADDAPAAADVARACNAYADDLRRAHPGRFGMFATLPMPHVEETLAEIAHALDELAADGVCLMTHYGARYLGHPDFAPVLAELDRRGAVVFVHPDDAPGRPLTHLPAATLEFPFATTRAIVDMLYAGTLARCRNARFVFSHAGGAVPFLADRIARLQRRPDLAANVPDGAIPELERLWFDLALSASPRVMGALTQLVPPTRILFASDFPHAPEDTMAGTVAALVRLGLDAESLAAVERGNALALMPTLAR